MKRWPVKHKARQAVHKAVRRGELVPKNICERCGEKGKTEYHHPSYGADQFLTVIECCRPCHVILDRERRENENS